MSDNGTSWIGKVISWFAIVVLAVVALKVGLALAGMALGLVFFLLFTVGPILLVGWLVIKLIRVLSRGDDYEPA
jgi:hypothetical protein